VAADRAHGVKSVPARFGIPAALYGARASHAVTTGLLVWYGLATGAGAFFWAGMAIVAGAFVYEHAIVRPHDLSRLNRAFFTVNGIIGITLFAFALCDLIARGLSW
jgi:4-hydroxybenzoate polyprenyltransferase